MFMHNSNPLGFRRSNDYYCDFNNKLIIYITFHLRPCIRLLVPPASLYPFTFVYSCLLPSSQPEIIRAFGPSCEITGVLMNIQSDALGEYLNLDHVLGLGNDDLGPSNHDLGPRNRDVQYLYTMIDISSSNDFDVLSPDDFEITANMFEEPTPTVPVADQEAPDGVFTTPGTTYQKDFCCPITHETMKDPVTALDGHS